MNDDLISRQAAINSIKECAEAAHDNDELDKAQGYLNAIECLKEETSIRLEPKAECWFKYKSMIYCPKCASGFDAAMMSDYNYCPNCGVKLSEE